MAARFSAQSFSGMPFSLLTWKNSNNSNNLNRANNSDKDLRLLLSIGTAKASGGRAVTATECYESPGVFLTGISSVGGRPAGPRLAAAALNIVIRLGVCGRGIWVSDHTSDESGHDRRRAASAFRPRPLGFVPR